MAERSQPHQQVQVRATPAYRYEGGGNPPPRYEGAVKDVSDQSGPSTSQVLAILAGVPIGGTLLLFAGLSLIGSLIGLAVATPLFVLFSPVLVPAAVTIGLAVAGILTSGACGLTGLNCIRQKQVSYGGQQRKDVGSEVQTKAPEAKRT